MKIDIPFSVEYKTANAVPIPEIIDSLRCLEIILQDAGKNLENFIHGLEVQKLDIRVQEISHGSLKELLVVSLIYVFQEDLENNMPDIFEDLTGIAVAEKYETLLVILSLAAIIYGADYVQKLLLNTTQDTPIRLFKKNMIKALAAETKKSEEEVEKILDDRFGAKTKLKQLGHTAVRFFKPSKSQGNAAISVGRNIIISPKTVQDAPADYLHEEAEKLEKSDHHYRVNLEIHAQDKDRDSLGWAAIPKGLHDKRLKLKLMDAAEPEQLWGKDLIVGDIVLVSKRVGLDFVPSEIHLSQIYEEY